MASPQSQQPSSSARCKRSWQPWSKAGKIQPQLTSRLQVSERSPGRFNRQAHLFHPRQAATPQQDSSPKQTAISRGQVHTLLRHHPHPCLQRLSLSGVRRQQGLHPLHHQRHRKAHSLVPSPAEQIRTSLKPHLGLHRQACQQLEADPVAPQGVQHRQAAFINTLDPLLLLARDICQTILYQAWCFATRGQFPKACILQFELPRFSDLPKLEISINISNNGSILRLHTAF